MRISLWNAYASNNSGSYTLVGGFDDAAAAARAAEALRPVLTAHTAWSEQEGAKDIADSPLARFAVRCGMPADSAEGDWPEYGRPTNCPEVIAAGHQIVVHHSYTASMTRFFGWWIYAQGGRVHTELNHAHAPVVVVCTMWWSWNKVSAEERAAHILALHAELSAADAEFRALLDPEVAAALAEPEAMNSVSLTAAFTDLVAGVAALRAASDRHGATMSLHVHEAGAES